MIICEILKLSIGRPRPNYYNTNKEKTASFPSLHAGLATSLLFLLSKMFTRVIKAVNNTQFESQVLNTRFKVSNPYSWFLLPFWMIIRCVNPVFCKV